MTPDLRYPVGAPQLRHHLEAAERPPLIDTIAGVPSRLSTAVAGLSQRQLDTPYRPAGWTVQQVVHHLADSHMNAFVRMKLALTEDSPTVKVYDEALWAELADSKSPPIESSLALLDALHTRWDRLMRSMTDQQWSRTMVHAERGIVTLDENLCLYAWHGRHHVAHITALREREGW